MPQNTVLPQQPPGQPARQATPPAGFNIPAHTGPITALQYIDRIRRQCNLQTTPEMLDQIVAGDPTTAVTGIATTAMASMDVLRAAAAANQNLVISMEPPFWNTADDLNRLEGNKVYGSKRDFLRAHNMVVYHLHQDWPAKDASGIATGMARALGWEGFIMDPAKPTSFSLPRTTLLDLAKQLSNKLHDRTLRVVGDPTMPVTRVGASWGRVTRVDGYKLANQPIDVAILGYSFEWETVEYVQDMVASGEKKALILLGEVLSEQAGMQYCAEWLKTFIPEVPVGFQPGVEPYWSPQEPVQMTPA